MMRLQGTGKTLRTVTLAATHKKKPLADADLFVKYIRDAAQGMSDANEETNINGADSYNCPEIGIMIQDITSMNDEQFREIELPTINVVPDTWPNVPLVPLRRYPLYPNILEKIKLTKPLKMDLIRHTHHIRDTAQGMSVANEETDVNGADNDYCPEIGIMIQEISSMNDEPCREIELPTINGVPDIWPNVPLLPLRRYPLYPYFLEKIELTNPLMMDLIRHKIQQLEPYVGAFLTKSDQAAECVFNLDELYTIGAFAEIKCIKDYGDKLSLMISAHRRIQVINGQTSPLPPLKGQPLGAQGLAQLKDNDSAVPEPVLYVNVKNFQEKSYKPNKKNKTLVSLVREQLNKLIGMNPEQKHILEKLIFEHRDLLTDPVYLCDLCASLTLGYREGMQEIMEEKDISQRLLLTLNLLKKECEDTC